MVRNFEYRCRITASMDRYLRDDIVGSTFQEHPGCYLFLDEDIKKEHSDGLHRIIFRVPGYTLGTLFVDNDGVINNIDLFDIAKDERRGPMKFTFYLNRNKFIGRKVDLQKIYALIA